MTNITGHCYCQQTRYTLKTAPVLAAYCHCTDCRKRTSSPSTSFIMGDVSTFTVEGETHSYTSTGGSGAPLEHHRCTRCGSIVYMRVHALKNIVAIPAETLDDKSHFKPQAHVWVSSKEPWLEINDDLPQMMGPPRMPKELINL